VIWSHLGDGKLFTNQDPPLIVPHSYTEIEAIYRAINNYLGQGSLEILDVVHRYAGMHGSMFGCMYLFKFKFRKFCRNSIKQATALYVLFPL
jgi:hypothetical protein